jgi:hypothetical protein
VIDEQPTRAVWTKGGPSPNPGGKRKQPDLAPENIGRNPDGTFAKGNSANPARKPKGARHRATLIAEALIDGQAEELVQRAVAMAMGGDASTMRALLDRLVAPRKERVVTIELPKIEKASDLIAASAALLGAVASGELTPAEASAMSATIGNVAQAIEVASNAERLTALEQAMADKNGGPR